MEGNLVIVESPAKANTIRNFLGKEFEVKSSFGHIRDLAKDNYGIDINNNYSPEYIISEDKKKIVAELRKSASRAKTIWLASDEDREGEAIAWHLSEVLELKPVADLVAAIAPKRSIKDYDGVAFAAGFPEDAELIHKNLQVVLDRTKETCNERFSRG